MPPERQELNGTAVVDEKAGYCQNCRTGDHALCMSPRCQCPDGRRHRNRPGFGSPERPARHTAQSSNGDAPPHSRASARNTARTLDHGKPPRNLPLTDTPTKLRHQAEVELVWEDPPVRQRGQPPIEARVALTLLEIHENPGHWGRIATHPSAKWGSPAAKRLKKHYGEGWTFDGGPIDTGGSAVWARYDGGAKGEG